MAIIDSNHVFSQAQSLILDPVGALYSTNTFDLTAAGGATSPVAGATQVRWLGVGEELYVNFLITTTVLAAAGAANITFFVGTDAVTTLASGYTEHARTTAIAKGTLILGYRFSLRVQPDTNVTPERYLGTAYTSDTNPITAGAVTSWMSREPATGHVIYASGLNFA